MENKSDQIEETVKKIVKHVASTTGHLGSDTVTRDCPRNLHQIIRSQVPSKLQLRPNPLPQELKLKILKLSKQHDEDSQELPTDPIITDNMPKPPTPTPSPSPGQAKKIESYLEVKNLPDTPVFETKALESFVRNKRLPKPISLDTVAIGFWQIADGVLKCKQHCSDLERQIERDIARVSQESDRARDFEHENRTLRSGIVQRTDEIEELKSVISQLEAQNSELTTNMAKMSNTQKEASDEVKRAELYTKLSQMHPSLIKEKWVNVDVETSVGYYSYPIFCANGVFYNPYKSCATEADVQEVNFNIKCSYPYMTIMSMALDSLPDSVKSAFIRELSSANTPLEFFLSLNAIARMSPIINQCIRALKESRDKENIEDLTLSIATAREQLHLNNTTMIAFMSQTEEHRNVLVGVSKNIQSFLEAFPDAPKVIQSCRPRAPPLASYILNLSDFVLMISGESARTAVIKRDKTCKNPEVEQVIVESVSVHLPAIFHLLTDNYVEAAQQLVVSLVNHLFERSPLVCKIEKWIPGAKK